MTSLDSFRCCKTLKVGSKTYAYYSLPTAEKNGLKGISRLPFSMKVLLENLLRNEDGRTVTKDDILAVAPVAQDQDLGPRSRVPPGAGADAGFHRRAGGGRSRGDARRHEEARRRSEEDQPAGAGRSGHRSLGSVNFFGTNSAFKKNVEEEYRQNQRTLRIPEMGAEVVRQFPRGAARHRHLPSGQSRISVAGGLDQEGQAQGRRQAVSTARSPIRTRWSAPTRTPPWSTACPCSAGASAASRRKPRCSASRYSMLLPEVIGFKLTGKLKEGVTATDLVLTVTQMLRKHGVVGKFVEFFGPGLAGLHDRRPRHASATCRRNTARPAASSRSTTTPSDICTDTGRTGRRRSAWWRPTPRRRACTAPSRRPTRCSPTSSSSICPPSSPRSPVRSARRIASRSRTSRTALPLRWTRSSTRAQRCRSACRSRAATTISATATW